MPLTRKARWIGAAIGLIASLCDTIGLRLIGIHLQSGGRDVTFIVAGWFGGFFSYLGYLVGKSIEDRARDKAASELIAAQLMALEKSRIQLAQSEKLAALGQLAAAIAHEVRNPLAIIRSAAQSFGDTTNGNQHAAHASSFITDEIDRLNSLVDSLLAFARPVQVMRHPVAVPDLIERATILASDTIAAKKIQLRCDIACQLPLANADPNLIAQVIAGLLSNAAQAVEVGGEIIVQARAQSSSIEIAIIDSGPGVAPEARSHIFEPFFTTRASGVGLGLAIARQIAEAHGGKIELDENAVGGARFNLTLPIAQAVGAAA
jgi:two-component system sensor histidine kinase HydH